MRKSQIKELYDKFLGVKCSMTLYYQRIKRGINPIEAMKPVEKKEFAVRSKLYGEQLERYKKQPQPKPPREKFYGRLQKGRTKEQAIQIQPIQRQRKQKLLRDIYIKTYTAQIQRYSKDYFEIRITYKPEEAEIFKKEYERMIQETEDKRNETDDAVESAELKKKLDKLVQEYSIFISYNKMTNESM